MSLFTPRRLHLAPIMLMLCAALWLTLTPSHVLSQNNPTSEERSLYTSTANITLVMLVTSLVLYALEPEESSALIAISTCSSELSELTSSTHQLHARHAAHFIETNRHALAADLILAQGPVLSDLLAMLGAEASTRRHLLHTHLPSSRRPLMLDALYDLEPVAWLELLLTHPDA